MGVFHMILNATVVLGIAGACMGVLLALASKRLAVKEDPKLARLTEALPGANCGACGRSGCRNMAEQLAQGKASPNDCPLTSESNREEICRILDIAPERRDSLCAQILCSGTQELAPLRFEYTGLRDCRAAMRFGGGNKACPYGCLGYGSCAAVCPANAIVLLNGIATVDRSRCLGCGLCVEACPKHLIRLLPAELAFRVGCQNPEKGVEVRKVCQVGCISCGICQKNCPADAITMENGVAVIDQARCTHCGLCAEKCPRKVIWCLKDPVAAPTKEEENNDAVLSE
ncbi:MAG: RnfABCDGE type electron transport complex subunit B [Clostridia bacterium]|nr:RnfABCDGE type electron transport complex subunit B [Clostridia bacterium]